MFKKFIDNVSKTLGVTGNAISDLVKKTNHYISAEESVVNSSKEGIAALKAYAETETPTLATAMNSLAVSFEAIEEARLEKVQKLRDEFIAPLNELVVSLETLQKEQAEAEKAVKDVEKAEKKVEKAKAKPPEKLKSNEIELAEKELAAAQEKAEKEQEDVKVETEKFNKEKLETMQKALSALTELETAFHDAALATIKDVKVKAEAIKVEEESKVE